MDQAFWKFSHFFMLLCDVKYIVRIFFQILWPSQNIWTTIIYKNLCRKSVSLKSQKHKNGDAIFKIQKGSGPIIEVTDYGRRFYHNPKLLGLGRQFG